MPPSANDYAIPDPMPIASLRIDQICIALWEIERLLETHGVDFRLSAPNKRFAFELIQPIVVMKHRDVRVTAVRSRDSELAAVDPANPVLDVELDQAAFGHLLYCTADQSTFLGLASYLRHFRDSQPERAGVLRRGVDVRIEGAAVGGAI